MKTVFFELLSMDMFNFIVKHSKVCVLDFSATWCGPCKKFAPLLEQTVEESELKYHVFYNTNNFIVGDDTTQFTGDLHKLEKCVTFLKIDVDKFKELADKFNIKSVPTILFYVNGELKNITPNGISLIDRAYSIIALSSEFLSN
jgi:thioredoxin 1